MKEHAFSFNRKKNITTLFIVVILLMFNIPAISQSIVLVDPVKVARGKVISTDPPQVLNDLLSGYVLILKVSDPANCNLTEDTIVRFKNLAINRKKEVKGILYKKNGYWKRHHGAYEYDIYMLPGDKYTVVRIE